MQTRVRVEGIFYGNYFYGVCAVALSIEAVLQQELPLCSGGYYVVVFALTTWYYTLPYRQPTTSVDPRTEWYQRYNRVVGRSQLILFLVVLSYAIWVLIRYGPTLWTLPGKAWLPVLSLPLVGLLYYGIRFDSRYSLRRIGVLKPFFIGFCWAVLCTWYPVLWHQLVHGEPLAISPVGYRLFVKNLMFIALIGIMFDIKDYATDAQQQLFTFVVKKGLRSTLYSILLPLSIVGLAVFWAYAFISHFSPLRTLLNTVPFIGLLIAVFALTRRRSILYYLVVIDGLLLLKAVCGSIGMIF